jgi:acyl carrier protein
LCVVVRFILREREMKNEEIFNSFKALLVKSHLNDDPSLTKEQLQEIRKEIDEKIHMDTPLSAVGLDSMKMTWLIVRFEERLNVNASGLSFFELYDVNDLVEELASLIKTQGAEVHA